MITIKLYGSLKQQFGSEFKLDVSLWVRGIKNDTNIIKEILCKKQS